MQISTLFAIILDNFREKKTEINFGCYILIILILEYLHYIEQISCYISKCTSIILKTDIDTWTTILFWLSFHYWKHFIVHCHQHRRYSFRIFRSVDLYFSSSLLALILPLLFHSSAISLLRSTFGSEILGYSLSLLLPTPLILFHIVSCDSA